MRDRGHHDATNSEISTSSVSLAARYSQNRSGVETTAPMVRSCFSKNTVPATKKNPMMEVSPSSTYGSATGRRPCGIGSSTASQISPGEDRRVQEPLPDLQGQLEPQRACQPGHDNRLPVTSTKTSSRLASLLWIVSTWWLRSTA